MTSLWLTDRSRYETGVGYCRRARYLEYHAGPNGYGLQPKALSIPLVTGSYVHDPLGVILTWCKDHEGKLPDETVVRGAIAEAMTAYQRICELRGLAFLDQEQQDAQYVQQEQMALMEGLIWIFVLYELPWIVEENVILEVEQEGVWVGGCTCGLGDAIGSQADHEARDCSGIGLQCRGDFLARRKSDVQLGYHEIKTTGSVDKRWRERWESAMQLAFAMADVEARYSEEVTHTWIHGLNKGYRARDKGLGGEAEGPRKQKSVLCYLFHRAANPPFCDEDWQPSWYWTDELGLKHTLSKKKGEAYLQEPVWSQRFPDRPTEMSPVEYWVRWLPEHAVKTLLEPVGPIPRKPLQVKAALRELVGEEVRWQEILWTLYEANLPWESVELQAQLDRAIPRGRQCHNRWGRPCSFLPLCDFQGQWQDPMGSGLFVPRRPHHAPELKQLEDRGLVPEDGWADEPEGDE